MGRGELSEKVPASTAPVAAPRRTRLAPADLEGAVLDVYDTTVGSDGEPARVQAAVYGIDGRLLALGEVAEVGIPGDDESYDSALGYSCSTAELEIAERLKLGGLSEEESEDLVEAEINRSDMPVY